MELYEVIEILERKGFEAKFQLDIEGLKAIVSKNGITAKTRLNLSAVCKGIDSEALALSLLSNYYKEVIF